MINKPMPFEFLLDYLPAHVVVLPVIGMFLIYANGKNVLIFRKTRKNPQHNGIWISTKKEYHDSLKSEIPAITGFDFEDHATESDWLLLSDAHEDFETAANQLCELVTAKDHRIGKITPKSTALFN
ncbi:hypothetical protein SAMN05216464_115152 [Mucilaginibacter pineti]|uniref:YjbR protein n=1 Tax=Mucilaginibacter pineti TaxID=1391627 RepID=A0A1G7JY30_9SPHI|nr:hypothetical protein [Mucilaginibacter pineti]SDF29751.1 hypothetical protein SAMN05216464_115152 [Mucilaginibacter pineti]